MVPVIFQLFLCWAFCLELFLASPAQGQERPWAESLRIQPAVLLSKPTDRCYVMKPDGGLEAVQLSSGFVVWATSEADLPLLSFGGRLLAQADDGAQAEISLAVFDTSDGRLLGQASLPLPDKVVARIGRSLAHDFSLQAIPDGPMIAVLWKSVRRSFPHDLAPGQTGRPEIQQRWGAFSLDPASMQFVSLEGASVRRLQRLAEPQARADFKWDSQHYSVQLRRIVRDGASQLVLQRWDRSGRQLEDAALQGSHLQARYPSLDGEHFLASRLQADSGLYKWSIFEVASGKLAARFDYSRPATRFLVAEGLVLVTEPARRLLRGGKMAEEPAWIRAIQARSGAVRWQRKVRGTAMRGSLPPSRP